MGDNGECAGGQGGGGVDKLWAVVRAGARAGREREKNGSLFQEKSTPHRPLSGLAAASFPRSATPLWDLQVHSTFEGQVGPESVGKAPAKNAPKNGSRSLRAAAGPFILSQLHGHTPGPCTHRQPGT